MERIKTLPVPEARGSLICDCKGTPFWQTDKTFTQLFSKQYASLIFTHYIYNTREKGKGYVMILQQVLRFSRGRLKTTYSLVLMRDLDGGACGCLG